MSAEHEHERGEQSVDPAAKPHDPRLDSSGEEHPGVSPRPFDLIALENTRFGLRLLGVGAALVSIGGSLAIASETSARRWVPITGWALGAAGFFFTMLAVTFSAPTPHGPLPKWSRAFAAFVLLVAAVSALVHCMQLFWPELSSVASDDIARSIDRAARVMMLTLAGILWRFCQHRGLTGRAIVWLWIAMASTGQSVAFMFAKLNWLLLGYPPLGVIAFFAAQHTARDVWLDAVYRNTKFHATNRSDAVVEPLRPAK